MASSLFTSWEEATKGNDEGHWKRTFDETSKSIFETSSSFRTLSQGIVANSHVLIAFGCLGVCPNDPGAGDSWNPNRAGLQPYNPVGLEWSNYHPDSNLGRN